MEVEFIENSPALLVKRENLLVVGDVHVGRDVKLMRSGIHLPYATERIAREILELCRKCRAKGVVLLGDVKDSVGYPTREEYQELGRFFYQLRDIDVTITKGNHDPRIEEVLKRLGADVKVEKELLLGKVALMHGHAMPSDEAMTKSCVVTAHSHPAVRINGKLEKAWAVAGTGDGAGRFYEKYNKRIRLVVMPAFNELITGSDLSTGYKFSPLFRNRIFDLESAKIYDLGKKLIGNTASLTG
ncbi:MAG TPA: metallophosphoesterase [Candidatus Saccharimonadales bacterium]|nr:metallophosphoesterase [Candidatus Saccharimonadales bacterium]